MNRPLSTLIAILIFGFASNSVQAGLVINTTATQRGGIGLFGEHSTGTQATFGQTFTATQCSVLSEFAFYVTKHSAYPDFFDYSFHLAKWNGGRVDGPILFSSPAMSTTDNGGAGGTEELRFQVNQTLNAGDVYVAFLTSEGHFDGVSGGVTVPIAGTNSMPDAYSGGEFVYAKRFDDFNALSTTNWNFNSGTNSSDFDTHFEAVFTPEPSGAVLFASAMMIFFRRHRV